jgi:hypothetical protein
MQMASWGLHRLQMEAEELEKKSQDALEAQDLAQRKLTAKTVR